MLLGCVPFSFVQNKKNNKIIKKNHLTRIVQKSFFLENELNLYSMIRSIPNYKEHFYLFFEAEKIAYHTLENDSLISSLLQTTDKFLLHYESKTFYLLSDVIAFLETEENAFEYLRFLIMTYQHLLKSMDLLNQHHIVHFVCDEGIGINENFEPILIQFEKSLPTTSMKWESIIQLFPYIRESCPLEFHILFYLHEHREEITALSKIHIEKILNELSLSNENKAEAFLFFRKYINYPLEKIMAHLCNDKISKSWNLSILNQLLLKHLTKVDPTNPFVKGLKELLLEGCRQDPEKRLTIQETKDRFEQMCYESDRKDFKEVQFTSLF